MLRLILNAHSDVAVPPESRFITELYDGRDEVDVDRFLRRLANHNRFALWDLPIEAVRAELGTVTRARYQAVIDATFSAWARVHGKTRWGDKTPRYVENVPLLARLFPDARFVHLIRDGRNVALSYADVPFGPKTVGSAAALWAARVGTGMRDGRRLAPGRYVEILYEDLVEDPVGEVKDVCSFLGLAFDPAMLDHTERARSVMLPSADRLNPHVTERPIKGVRSWETEMPARHVEIFEAIAGDVLAQLGYERRFPRPRFRARVAARLGGWGLPLDRLRSNAGRGRPGV